MMSIAHRGASSYAPENTQSAFQKGLKLVRILVNVMFISKDGPLILIHDDKVIGQQMGKVL